MKRYRWVVDTNALISRLLLPDSVPARAVRRAVDTGTLLVSDETLDELVEVLGRPKFDRYVSLDDRRGFLDRLLRISEHVIILTAGANSPPRQSLSAARDGARSVPRPVRVTGAAGLRSSRAGRSDARPFG